MTDSVPKWHHFRYMWGPSPFVDQLMRSPIGDVPEDYVEEKWDALDASPQARLLMWYWDF